MSKETRRLVIASVLKPIDDPRMFEKFALSLCAEYEVHIIGFPSVFSLNYNNIYFHSLPFSSRKSAKRWKMPLFIWNKIQKIKPELLIVNTVELLPLALIFKFRSKAVIYDIRENYFKNILFQTIYPSPLRQLMAVGVRMLEKISAPFIDHFILAERSYQNELRLSRSKISVIENKFKTLPNIRKKEKRVGNQVLRLAFTGTISKVYGALEAVNFAIGLHDFGEKVLLKIAGNFIEDDLKKQLVELSNKYDFIQLEIGNPLAPHLHLMEILANSDFALLSYQPNKSTKDCIPTRLYECLALGIPMLIPKNALWENICSTHRAAITVDFKKPNYEAFLKLKEKQNPYPLGAVKEALWESEEVKLKRLIKEVLL